MAYTDDIRAAADAVVSQANIIKGIADDIDALPPPECAECPPSGEFEPLLWPTGVNLLGGTPPSVISIPAGDGAPTGIMGAPGFSRKLNNRPDGTVWVFGDSIIQATSEGLISPFAANYALGGQSLRRLINDLHGYAPYMSAGGAGVIASGVNDLSNITYYGPRSNHQAAQMVIWMFQNKIAPWITGKWVISHLLPCNESATGATGYNAQCLEVNNALSAAMSGSAAQIAFAPVHPDLVDGSGNLKMIYTSDGQHLNKEGCMLLGESNYEALKTLNIQ